MVLIVSAHSVNAYTQINPPETETPCEKMEDTNAGKLPEKREVEIPDGSMNKPEDSKHTAKSPMSEFPQQKVRKIVWTPEIDKKFVEAVDQLGGQRAVPYSVLKLMNVDGLSRSTVASRLKEYRMNAATSRRLPIKFGSLVKFVININRWKSRVLERRRQDQTAMIMVESSPYTLVHDDSHQDIFDMDASSFDDALHYYCALFPSDHVFEKDTLIQLWIAVGFFEEEATLFFEDCLTKGYLHFFRTNLVTGKAMYKSNENTQLLPKSISNGSHIVRVEASSDLSVIPPQVSHVSIRCCNREDFTAALCRFKKFKHLKTLILLNGHQMNLKQLSHDFFVMLRQLRVLDLSKTRLMALPSSIGSMKCLRYLDLSGTLLKRLPETIDCLDKLQTLKLRGCSNLSTLPKGMRKLVNLRHLDFDVIRQLRSMPEGMGDLTNIQTLSAFLVGVEEGCSIRQIKSMNNLSGSFCISRLENVLTKDEAEEACLSSKSRLKKIELHWSDSQDEDVVRYGNVISSLQPATSLEELNISCYGGLELPSWICDPEFSKLVSMTLFECENCLVLPSLGQLPSLKYLNISDFHNLKVIDHKFYGDSGVEGHIAFPKLEKLTVENMLSLEEWSGIRSYEFPSLLNLTVKHCPKLHNICTLSSLCSLKNLEISHCAVLTSCPDGMLPARVDTFIIEDCPLISVRILNGGQDWQKVAHIPHVWIDHEEIIYG